MAKVFRQNIFLQARRVVNENRGVAPLDVLCIAVRKHLGELEQEFGHGVGRGIHLHCHGIDARGHDGGGGGRGRACRPSGGIFLATFVLMLNGCGGSGDRGGAARSPAAIGPGGVGLRRGRPAVPGEGRRGRLRRGDRVRRGDDVRSELVLVDRVEGGRGGGGRGGRGLRVARPCEDSHEVRRELVVMVMDRLIIVCHPVFEIEGGGAGPMYASSLFTDSGELD
mmetsp:Transcript_53889/g.114492  ORF Transcript_53889/g.114492 Transcript_53889/m.114492 type:complete len:224 (-) Transcript_53889:199-870(-)